MKTLTNFILFQVGWFACVLGAAHGIHWAPPVSIGIVVTMHLAMSSTPRREATLLAGAAVVGALADTLLIAAGACSPVRWLAPAPLTTLWLVLMWVNFATTLNVSLAWLKGRHVLGAILGAFGGPMAYYAGERLGAIVIARPLAWSLLGIAVSWALAIPLLTGLASRIASTSRTL